MDRESPSVNQIIDALGARLPLVNFYRFCQLLEQYNQQHLPLGSTQDPKTDAIRFRPHRGMGFPVTEIKGLDIEDRYRNSSVPSIRTTFLGLYGITSPLPTAYIDDIAQRREGTESLTDFLDIFNHRLITQFYRIWRKYSYPATFLAGGKDETSQYLYGLIGLGIPGTAQHIQAPLSRFLALLGTLRFPTRTAEGVISLVKLLAPDTQVQVKPHDPRRIEQESLSKLSCQKPMTLINKPVLGQYATDVNSQILIMLQTDNLNEARNWLPDGQLYQDLLALLHVYLGSRVNARLSLKLPRSLLPNAALSTQSHQGVQLGRTAAVGALNPQANLNDPLIVLNLGRYQRLTPSPQPIPTTNYANYRF
ncbi:type VI secretion system baseplate subunit TssG [Providencia vermicola]|uniref:type VI secretion system baseplate subunit TssG n=1 Tax=Providencia vermicola TaxID=333965 RepID=UPI0013A73A3E|nr:type VI secretion system baseplate subunit TssG [Providencia vermicola]QIC16670.1 type VI secretion system baseplate subunit TssG [Providencia vermicola]